MAKKNLLLKVDHGPIALPKYTTDFDISSSRNLRIQEQEKRKFPEFLLAKSVVNFKFKCSILVSPDSWGEKKWLEFSGIYCKYTENN